MLTRSEFLDKPKFRAKMFFSFSLTRRR